jgi:threonine-phosphate decarboxylase
MHAHGGNVHSFERGKGIPKKEIIDFSSSINPLGISEKLREEINRSISELVFYPDPDYTECRENIARYHGVRADSVIVGNGATELISLYSRSIDCTNALVVAPTYSEYARTLTREKIVVTYFYLSEADQFNFDVGSLKKSVTHGCGVVVICSPNNPTGSSIGTDGLADITAYAASKGALVFLDESFLEFDEAADKNFSFELAREYDNLFILRSLTKIFAVPGLRLGYAITHNRRLHENFRKMRDPWSVNVFAANAVRAVLGDGEYLARSREWIIAERSYLFERLSAISWLEVFPSAANFFLVKIKNGMTAAGIQEVLLRDNILIRDASNFIGLDENFFRIAVKDRESNAKLVNSLLMLSAD